MGRQFSKVLIANRGEIAVRVIRGCQRRGYATVAVYSDADRDAMHVWAADEAVRIGPAPVGESYLVSENILAAARQTGAGAIHPGYGFLSENAAFARAVTEAGLVFIGPGAEAIDAMGNKSASKRLMLEARVPCVPGYQGDDQSDATLLAEARKIELPVMVKAAAGGGGRGMRLVDSDKELAAAIKSARSEAQNAFGDGQLLLEKAVVNARHVEIQVFGDTHGNVVHLGERDCSIQRRNQKVVEESPSPAVDVALRLKMGAAAVAAAKAVNYVGAGTVEFLLGADKQFYFLEMNTRLQVEHPVTELVYGVDLVEWQLRIAQGEPLPMTQEEILVRRNGHAIEVRLCAEDPANGYVPQTGPVLAWHVPAGDGMRADHGITAGRTVSPYYDSMLGKLIAYGNDREAARSKLLQMLADTSLLGIISNRDFLLRIIAHPAFAGGDFSTGFIAEHFPAAVVKRNELPGLRHRALAAALLFETDARNLQADSGADDSLLGWRNSNHAPVPMKLSCRDAITDAQLLPAADSRYSVTFSGGEETQHVQLTRVEDEVTHFVCEDVQGRARFVRAGNQLWLSCDDEIHGYVDLTYAPAKTEGAGGDGRILAHMDGKIVAVHVEEGAAVEQGQTLMVLEAMKMEFQIKSPLSGSVSSLGASPGAQVSLRQLLAVIEPATDH